MPATIPMLRIVATNTQDPAQSRPPSSGEFLR